MSESVLTVTLTARVYEALDEANSSVTQVIVVDEVVSIRHGVPSSKVMLKYVPSETLCGRLFPTIVI